MESVPDAPWVRDPESCYYYIWDGHWRDRRTDDWNEDEETEIEEEEEE